VTVRQGEALPPFTSSRVFNLVKGLLISYVGSRYGALCLFVYRHREDVFFVRYVCVARQYMAHLISRLSDVFLDASGETSAASNSRGD
jgi:hypothetical protein